MFPRSRSKRSIADCEGVCMSLRMLAGITAMMCGLSLAAAAQAPPTPPTAPDAPAPPAKARSDKPAAPALAIPPPRHAKNVNIRIDATVAELRGTQVVDKKVISVTCVD